jgi:hypothetical protein
MVLDQRITQLTAALQREATGAPLSPQRLARLQTLTQELAEVLTTATKSLHGGLSLEGDLWPERDDSEENSMDQTRMLMLMDALEQIGVAPLARQDALVRTSQYFGGHDVADWEITDFAQQLRRDAPHLFRHAASTPTTAPTATGSSQGKRKEPPQPPERLSTVARPRSHHAHDEVARVAARPTTVVRATACWRGGRGDAALI